MIRPLAACTVPLMMVTLAALLEGYSVLAFLYIGFPASLLIAGIWTWITIREEIVEVHFRGSDVAMRSLISAAAPVRPLEWFRLLEVVLEKEIVLVTVGHEQYRLRRSEWPEKDSMIELLIAAQAAHAVTGKQLGIQKEVRDDRD